MAILEPERFKKTYSIMPNFGNQTLKVNKEKRAAWLADQTPGKEFVSEAECFKIEGMRDALDRKDNFKYLMDAEDMATELTFVAELFGRDCKVRADAISIKHRRIIDLKTTISARPDSFKYSVKDYGYDVQAAFYLNVIAAATATTPDEWTHYTIAVEKEGPYENQFFSYTQDAMTAGLEKVKIALSLLDECEQSGKWYGYPDIILPIEKLS